MRRVREGSASNVAGPVVLVMDFTQIESTSPHSVADIVTALTSPTPTGSAVASNVASDISAALSTFGLLFTIAGAATSASSSIVDGCVPTAVLGLFRNHTHTSASKGKDGGAASPSSSSRATVESVWLYNSMDAHNLIAATAAAVDGNNDADGGEEDGEIGAAKVKRANRLWTTNRHFETGVLPIVLGTLKHYAATTATSAAAAGASSPSDAASGGNNLPSEHMRSLQAALLKALCFINRHSGSEAADAYKRRLANGGSTANILLATFSAVGSAANNNEGNKEQKPLLPSAVPTISELATSTIAAQLVSTGTQLYVGYGCGSSDGDSPPPTCLAPLFALAAAAGGGGGTLIAPQSPSAAAMPTVADHILGLVDEAARQQTSKNSTNNSGGGSGPQMTAAHMAAKMANYPIHYGCEASAAAAQSSSKADGCGVSHVDNETLCLMKV